MSKSPYAPKPPSAKEVEDKKKREAVVSQTVEASMEEKILVALKVHGKPTIKWFELMHLCGPKAVGDKTIQLDSMGTRDHNIKIWFGVSKDFHDAIQKLRDEKKIRLTQASPAGYFPGAVTPPLPLAHDYRIGYSQPHLFLTLVELMA